MAVKLKPHLCSCHALCLASLPVRPAADQIWPAAAAAPAYTTSFSDHILPISWNGTFWKTSLWSWTLWEYYCLYQKTYSHSETDSSRKFPSPDLLCEIILLFSGIFHHNIRFHHQRGLEVRRAGGGLHHQQQLQHLSAGHHSGNTCFPHRFK